MPINSVLDVGVEELMVRFAAAAGMSEESLVASIMNGHSQEMSELLDFASCYPHGADKHESVQELIRNYNGGDYIYEVMKKIDPEYQTPAEWMMSLDDSFVTGLMDSLDGCGRCVK